MNNLFHKPALQRIDWLDQRFYQYDSQTYLPSVTEILSVYPKGFGFENWLKDVGNNASQIADRAANSGTKVHNAVETIIAGIEVRWADDAGNAQYTLEEWGMINKFYQFLTKHKPEIIASETQIYTLRHGYAGTIDLVIRMNGKTWLVDVKTSNYLHTGYELQLSAYATAWNENTETHKIDQTGILWLKASTRTEGKKDAIQGPGWQLKTFERPYEQAFKVFQHTHEIWKEENPDPKPKIFSLPDRFQVQIVKQDELSEAIPQ
jgi:hypothetical protein